MESTFSSRSSFTQSHRRDSAAPLEVAVVMPCLNEAETVGECVKKAQAAMLKHGISGEVVVADNGSTDDSVEIARKIGARVVHVDEKGYGNALRGGIATCATKYVIMHCLN